MISGSSGATSLSAQGARGSWALFTCAHMSTFNEYAHEDALMAFFLKCMKRRSEFNLYNPSHIVSFKCVSHPTLRVTQVNKPQIVPHMWSVRFIGLSKRDQCINRMAPYVCRMLHILYINEIISYLSSRIWIFKLHRKISMKDRFYTIAPSHTIVLIVKWKRHAIEVIATFNNDVIILRNIISPICFSTHLCWGPNFECQLLVSLLWMSTSHLWRSITCI